MKRTIKPDEKGVGSMDSTSRGDSQNRCKIPRTQDTQSPSRSQNPETPEPREMLAAASSPVAASGTGLPQKPRPTAEEGAVSGEPVEGSRKMQSQPSAKEIAAAKAARIRLGLEKDDGSLQASESAPPGLPSGVEPSKETECEYIATADLKRLDDPDAALQGILESLTSKNWVEQFKSLNVVRQLVVHHTDLAKSKLESLMTGILKLVKSPRSSISKTAVMCCCNLFECMGDSVLAFIDVGGPAKPTNSLVSQLLLKASSNDKQFVVEETHRTLMAMAQCLSSISVIDLLVPYTKHKSPKVRGKAAIYLTNAINEMDSEKMQDFKLERLLEIAGNLIKDNTQDARNSAKKLARSVQIVFEGTEVVKEHDENGNVCEVNGEGDDAEHKSPWEQFCFKHLNSSTAGAIVKSTK